VSRRVRISGQAKAELDAIWDWVARNGNTDAATHLIDSITDTFFLLWRHPGLGRRRNDLGPEAGSFPVGNYIVYYRRRKRGIEISRVIHGSRDQARALKGE
jgi:toxin ParE1/3/4